MICKSCGSQIPDGVKFCSKCGSVVIADENTGNVNETAAQQEAPAANPFEQQNARTAQQNTQNGQFYQQNAQPGQFENGQYQNRPEDNTFGNQEPASGAATAGMVLGILGCILWIIPPLGYPINIIGLVLSVREKNKGYTSGIVTAGLVCSIIGLSLTGLNSILCAIIACSTPRLYF